MREMCGEIFIAHFYELNNRFALGTEEIHEKP
jgi:hypothetical protein